MKKKDTTFYKISKPLTAFIIKLFFHPKVIGLENIPKKGRILLAGNHTKWLDPVTLVGITKRQIHFLAKEELFHGKVGWIVRGMGCVPVNRKIHDKNALQEAIDYLKEDLCVGIFPEGTINRTEDVIMPFKIGAVKSCYEANAQLIPFIITGKYKVFGKSVTIEFLKPRKIGENLEEENNQFMEIVKNKLIEGKKSNE